LTDSDDEEESEKQIHGESGNAVIETSPKGRFIRFTEELGRGAYKIVYKGIDLETGREIAWNVVNLRKLSKNDRIRIKSEIDLIKKLQHQNIIHFISAWINKEKDEVVMITEMITGGSLRSYVKKYKHVRLKVIKRWCVETLKGLVYLHE
jgi:WNK lysine deficient protein kinase